MQRALQEMWMPLDSIVAIWNTNHNKTQTANSGGTATYPCNVFDRIDNNMTQMKAAVETCTSVTTIFPFLTSFF